jgi:hypothetical protein
MSAPNYDAREVLERFVATLGRPGDEIVRDARDLAHPKDVIKSALQLCIRTIEGGDQLRFLRHAYLSLGSYQVLSEQEREALSALREIGPPGEPGSDLQGEQAIRIKDFALPLHAILLRLKEETAVLAQELKLLPGQD